MKINIGIEIKTKETLTDERAEGISRELNRLIEREVKQIVQDISHGSGVEFEVSFT